MKWKAQKVPAMHGRKMHVIGIDIRLTLSSPETGGNYYVSKAVTPPDVGVPLHVHQHEDEIIHVIEGEYDICLDGKFHKATTGAVLNFYRHIPHAFRNVGQEPGRALFVVTPGMNFEKFFEELSALPANAPPNLANVAQLFKRYDINILDLPNR